MKKQKLKQTKFPIKWNIGQHKYESELPIIRKKERPWFKKNRMDIRSKIMLIITFLVIIIFFGVLIYLLV